MIKGISNVQIENAIESIGDEDLNDNFVGVFPSNGMSKFINHSAMISSKNGKYPFVIANTDSSEKGGTHWWSILDIEPKTDIFFFDSFGIDGLKHFIVQDDRKIIKKILFGTEKMTRTDSKITLCNNDLILVLTKIYLMKSLMLYAIQLMISFALFLLLTTGSNYAIL